MAYKTSDAVHLTREGNDTKFGSAEDTPATITIRVSNWMDKI